MSIPQPDSGLVRERIAEARTNQRLVQCEFRVTTISISSLTFHPPEPSFEVGTDVPEVSSCQHSSPYLGITLQLRPGSRRSERHQGTGDNRDDEAQRREEPSSRHDRMARCHLCIHLQNTPRVDEIIRYQPCALSWDIDSNVRRVAEKNGRNFSTTVLRHATVYHY